ALAQLFTRQPLHRDRLAPRPRAAAAPADLARHRRHAALGLRFTVDAVIAQLFLTVLALIPELGIGLQLILIALVVEAHLGSPRGFGYRRSSAPPAAPAKRSVSVRGAATL